jgi:transcriptional regulator with XRE-family HTH domain
MARDSERDAGNGSGSNAGRAGLRRRAQPWYELEDTPAWRLRLRLVMLERDVTARELSVRSGVPVRTIRASLAGTNHMRLNDAEMLARGLGVSAAYLLFGVQGEVPSEAREREALRRQLAQARKVVRHGLHEPERAGPEAIRRREQNFQTLLRSRPQHVSLNAAGDRFGMAGGMIYRLAGRARARVNLGAAVARRIEVALKLPEMALDNEEMSEAQAKKAWREAFPGG